MFLLICFCYIVLKIIFLIKKKNKNRSRRQSVEDEEIVRHIIETDLPILNEKGEFEYVQCETIVFGDERFDELIESSNNPNSW